MRTTPTDMTGTPATMPVTPTHPTAVMEAMDGGTVMVAKGVPAARAATAVMAGTQGKPVAKVEKAAAEETQQGTPVLEMGEEAVGAMMVVAMGDVAAMPKTGGVATVVVAGMPPAIQEVATVAKVVTRKREREVMADAAARLKRLVVVVMAVTVGMGDRLGMAALAVTQLVAPADEAKGAIDLRARRPSCQTALITIPAWKTSQLLHPIPISR